MTPTIHKITPENPPQPDHTPFPWRAAKYPDCKTWTVFADKGTVASRLTEADAKLIARMTATKPTADPSPPAAKRERDSDLGNDVRQGQVPSPEQARFTESDLRAAWESGFKLCRVYGDNYIHFDGEQKEAQWEAYRRQLAAVNAETELRECGKMSWKDQWHAMMADRDRWMKEALDVKSQLATIEHERDEIRDAYVELFEECEDPRTELTALRDQLATVQRERDEQLKSFARSLEIIEAENTALDERCVKAERIRGELVGLVLAAKCPSCDGSGVIAREGGVTEYVSRDMASDAGDPSLEGSVYREAEPVFEQCQWCAMRAAHQSTVAAQPQHKDQ